MRMTRTAIPGYWQGKPPFKRRGNWRLDYCVVTANNGSPRTAKIGFYGTVCRGMAVSNDFPRIIAVTPASDPVLRRFLCGELCQSRPGRRRHHERADPVRGVVLFLHASTSSWDSETKARIASSVSEDHFVIGWDSFSTFWVLKPLIAATADQER